MRKHLTHCFILLLASTLLLACSNTTQQETVNISHPLALEQGEWQLVSIDGQSVGSPVTLTILFTREGRVNGNGGCNRFFGIYSAQNDGQLTIGQVGSTRKFCPELAALERQYFTSLSNVSRFVVDDDRLQLFSSAGDLEFILP